ncbi:helix-turn-helix domain-containing protein [Roseateles toxinivorans]|uniref:helix-turn-helix domain-containing protein n=1 Tax=Roseateles toxinivorans TaxID=270368 RepID=UPI0010613A13|nr:helix-turn-helix transcriptional regulator [Roseateles toxinivorans]
MRSRRETLGWSQERVGVAVGIEESSSRTRISRYESGVHEPPTQTARLIAKALKVPLAYLYCEDDAVAALLVSLYQLSAGEREVRVGQFSVMLAEGGS